MTADVTPPKPQLPNAQGKTILCFGYGYTANAVCETLKLSDWSVVGTTTDESKADLLAESGVKPIVFDSNHPLCNPYEALENVTHILLSIPPDDRGDIVYMLHDEDIARMKNLEWIGYLSTTGVYGNRDGTWVDETSMPAPTSRRGSLRYKAEQQWLSVVKEFDIPLHIFRLSGIYGPGRSALDSVRAGQSRRIDKPGHAFNRIHIDDIVQTLVASINKPNPGAIYNLADDNPAPSHEVIAYACTLLGVDVPELTPFEDADLAPMVRSFYKDNKRIRNALIKSELGVQLFHPDYKSGLSACFEAEKELYDLVD